MSAIIYLEGGIHRGKDLRARCKEGFHKLISRFLPAGHAPRLVSCGGRGDAYRDFCTELRRPRFDYVGLLVDSEEPVIKAPWAHLLERDNWTRPKVASDDQVLFLATCMETWCCADHPTLRKHYGAELNENRLPPLHRLEIRNRTEVQDALELATENCTNSYAKGGRSFTLLAELDPAALAINCPVHFVRTRDLLMRHC